MVLNNPTKKFVALAGGVGGAKLVYGLSKILPPECLTIIGNVGDDFDLYGLHISPDLDTVMYTLAELANPATGWGIQGDTLHTIEMLRRYGEDVWFQLGDQDLGTHILRTQGLAQGLSLTKVTARLCAGLGIKHQLLPVTNARLRTTVDTIEEGTLAFQDYFVRHRWQPTVQRVWFDHDDQASITEEAAQALHEADVIVICPSNPVLSVAPILEAKGCREAVEGRKGKCVAVSPFVGGKAVKGPAEKLMRELGLDISPSGLIGYYGGLLDGLVIDNLDCEIALNETIPILTTQTLMQSSEDKVRLAEEVIEWVGSISG
jgi:LPPG:FO 2-phospho-L-lactate transferase